MAEIPSSLNDDGKDDKKESPQKDDLFFRLFMANQKSIYAFILALVHNATDADDIMQETMTVMWRKFDDFDPSTSFIAWGIQIARYRTLKFRNEHKKPIQFNDDLLKNVEKQAVNRHEQITDRIKALRNCVKELAVRDRQMIQLRYEQSLTIKDLANHVGRPIHGMYKAMSRIHDALLKCVRRKLLIDGEEI